MNEPTGIVVVSDEELFVELMERFSPQTHLVQYADSLTEASGYCANSPGLMVVSVDQPSAELDQLLNNCSLNDVRVLGLYQQAASPDLPVDRLAPVDHRELVCRAAAELLNERRSYPRVPLQLSVEVEGLGRAYSSTASAVSIFIETEAILEAGTEVAIQIPHGAAVVSGAATVVRAGLGDSGNVGMVLAVSGEAVSAFLRERVREALKAYYEQWMAQAPQQQAQARPAQAPQPEPDYHELNVSAAPDDAAAYDEGYEESTKVQAFTPVATGEQIQALQARMEKQQEIIERLVLRLREIGKAREPAAAAGGADQGAVAEALQQIATIGGRIEAMEQEREPLQAGLFETSERLAELERRVEALAQDDPADRLSDLREAVDALGARIEAVEVSAAARDAGHHELSERLDQLTDGLEQAREKTALDLEQRFEQQLVSVRTTVEEADVRVAELTQRLEQLRDGAEQAQTRALEAQREATLAQQQAAGELEQRLRTELEALEQRMAPQQTAQELEQRLQTELEELEQRMQAGQSPLQVGLEGASQLLVELSERIDALAGQTVAGLQEQQRVVEKRLSKVEGVASDAATQDALESSVEALLHRTEQLAQRVEQAEGTVLQVTKDLEQAQEKAQQREQARGDTAQEVEKRLQGRLAELQEWVAEMGGAIPNEKVLNEREEALTRRIEALIDGRLQESASESAASLKQTVSQETATALESFEEIRTEVRNMLEGMVKQLREAQGQIEEQAKVLSRVVHRLDRMQKD
jgi:DNA repair exonuclease SbcCD ATPase subunit